MYGLASKKMFKESILRASAAKTLTNTQFRCAGVDPLKDKEKGDERIYFTKQDGKFKFLKPIFNPYLQTIWKEFIRMLTQKFIESTLKNLIKKMQKQQQLSDPTPAELDRQKTKLGDIFKDHKIDIEKHKGFFDALLEWKRHL